MNKVTETNSFLINLGSKIAKIRKEKGLTQEALADKADKGTNTISNIECGKVNPEILTLKSIAEVLEVNIADVVDVESVRNPMLTKSNEKIIDNITKTLQGYDSETLIIIKNIIESFKKEK